VAYKVLDRGYRTRCAFNCIHAVSDIDADPGLLDTGAAYGVQAGLLVVQHFRRWMVNLDRSHEWVSARLGLTGLAVERRAWQ
jgi:hypothetical protein